MAALLDPPFITPANIRTISNGTIRMGLFLVPFLVVDGYENVLAFLQTITHKKTFPGANDPSINNGGYFHLALFCPALLIHRQKTTRFWRHLSNRDQ